MKDVIVETYEAPQLMAAGEFQEVTLGRNSWGFDSEMLCRVINCQPA